MEQSLLYSNEHLILAEFLNVSDEELDDIEENWPNNFTYDGDEYEVYDRDDLDVLIEGIIQEKIDDTTTEIERINMGMFNYGNYMEIIVNDDAIRDDINTDFGYHIGNCENEYDIFKDYYIFKK